MDSQLKTIIIDDKFYTFNSKSEVFINNSDDGKLITKYQIIENENSDHLSSMYFKDNYFILGFRSGKIIKTDIDGNIIWEFTNKKIFNSVIYELNNVVLVLYVDTMATSTLPIINTSLIDYKFWEGFIIVPIIEIIIFI